MKGFLRRMKLWNVGPKAKMTFFKLIIAMPILAIVLIFGLYFFGFVGTKLVVRIPHWSEKAREVKVRTDLGMIIEAARMYKEAKGSYPATLEEMIGAKDLNGQKIETSLGQVKDPWGNKYLYQLGTDGIPHARCLGRDAAEGGEGENRDYEWPEPKASKR